MSLGKKLGLAYTVGFNQVKYQAQSGPEWTQEG